MPKITSKLPEWEAMDHDVTSIFDHYRISARSVWNTAFWPDPNFRTGEFIEEYESIERILFDSLVLSKLDLEFSFHDIFRKVMPFFRVTPQAQAAPILIQCPRPGDTAGYWDDPIKCVERGKVEMHFLSFFDWDQMSYLDLHYYRVRISEFEGHPNLVGRDALIERQYVSVLHMGEQTDSD